jgi:hypothetical protein
MMLTTKRVALAALALLLITMAWLPGMQSSALQQSEEGLKRALTTYAIARGLNAAISVAQGTELVAEPMGFGASIAIGQVLDPINDLVEQFSSLMLLASVAFGLQIFLIKIGGHALVSMALTATLIAYVVMVVWQGRSPGWLARLVVILALVRFAVPMTTLASEQVYLAFLQQGYDTAQSGLEGANSSLQKAKGQLSEESQPGDTAPGAKAESWWRAWLDRGAMPTLPKIPDFKKVADDIKAAADSTVRYMIDLMVVFLLQTIVLPLLFLWGLVVGGRSLVSSLGDRAGGRTTPSRD